jgi:hypothetical protein
MLIKRKKSIKEQLKGKKSHVNNWPRVLYDAGKRNFY